VTKQQGEPDLQDKSVTHSSAIMKAFECASVTGDQGEQRKGEASAEKRGGHVRILQASVKWVGRGSTSKTT